MKMRAPSVPLFNVDPYFSVWSSATCLTDRTTIHWTEKNNTILGKIYIDGKPYRFMGEGEEVNLELMELWVKVRDEAGGRTKEAKEKFLAEACQIQGVYVPKFYTPLWDEKGKLLAIEPFP